MNPRSMSSQNGTTIYTNDYRYKNSGSYDSGSDNIGCASTDTACLHNARTNISN